MKINHCFIGDNRAMMRQMLADGYAGKIQCVVTSPPYWGLRDYGVDGQLGLEPTLQEFLAHQVEVFALVWELLADDGTLWMNMGDCYMTQAGKVAQAPGGGLQGERWAGQRDDSKAKRRGPLQQPNRFPQPGFKPKDIAGQPWRLAFALQDFGWYLRQDIIWHKPNPMPESVRDRCTKSHEYLFLLTKSERYYFDQDAIKEPGKNPADDQRRMGQQKADNKSNPTETINGLRPRKTMVPAGWKSGNGAHGSIHDQGREPEARYTEKSIGMANKRSVWTIPTESYSEAHFATFPRNLVRPCVLAGSKPGQIVFDPYMGSGTVAQVALELGRNWLGCELNPDYVALQDKRTRQSGLALEVA